MADDLEPIDPRTAIEMYLDDRRNELSEATIKSHRYRLRQFAQWCENEHIENLNTLSGRDLHQFRVKRQKEDGLAKTSMRGQLATLRMFLRFAASIDAVEPTLNEKVLLPTTTEDDAREEMLSAEQAKEVLDYLRQYHYADLKHVWIEVLWHTGIRSGTGRALDIEDFNEKEQYLAVAHRPEMDTPLKNGSQGERLVAVNDRIAELLTEWLEVHHPGTKDEHGREPLFATKHGRLSSDHARTMAYQVSRPCVYGESCPHDRDPETCEAIETARAYACPSSLSTHPIRRGSITHHLQEDTPQRYVSSRMDVGIDVLDRHYDQRSDIEKLRQRRQYLPNED